MAGDKKKGKKYTQNDWLHVSIWCRPSEWDRLNYLSASSTKSVSTWAIDKLLAYKGQVVEIEHPAEQGKSRPLCVPADKWEIVKERAEKAGMSISNYVLSVLLGGE